MWRYIIAVFFLAVLPSVALAIQSNLRDQGEVLVRLPDQYLNANNYTIPEVGKAIVADLEKMKVILYEDGVATTTYPILSKGRKGTPWETPSGVYQVLLKEKNHFSSIGHVFMPWSMQFYGNFFIHGWPYDAEGNDVPRGYSGGCVRLSTPDSEAVYRFAERGTAVVVRAKDEQDLSGGYYVSTNTLPPALSARSLVVMDLDRGQILWKKDSGAQFSDPLTGKYLSALASLEHMNQYTMRTLPKGNMLASSWLDRRSTLPAKDLIAPLLFSEETSIEEFFARQHGRKLFIRAMEEKARAFGMQSTSVEDLGGASTTNKTTATDMVHLLRAMDQSKRYLLDLTDRPIIAIPDGEGEEPAVIVNTRMLPDESSSIRGGLADEHSGNAMFVFVATTSGATRSIAVGLSGSEDIEKDIKEITGFLTSGITYVAGRSEGVVAEQPVGFFTKIRMIWNRKRIGDMLLGVDVAPNHTALLRSALNTPSI